MRVRQSDAEWPDGLFVEAPDGEYHEASPTDEDIRSIELELGYRLPAAYVHLARRHNGGLLRLNAHSSPTPTSWAPDHVAVTGIFAIGRTARSSLCGDFGQRLWLEEWRYPAIGIYFADTPSAGHDMIALDYRSCGPLGEPPVVHVDQELDFAITPLAASLDAFLGGLVHAEAFAD